jgi:hypothetical protein
MPRECRNLDISNLLEGEGGEEMTTPHFLRSTIKGYLFNARARSLDYVRTVYR